MYVLCILTTKKIPKKNCVKKYVPWYNQIALNRQTHKHTHTDANYHKNNQKHEYFCFYLKIYVIANQPISQSTLQTNIERHECGVKKKEHQFHENNIVLRMDIDMNFLVFLLPSITNHTNVNC